MRLGRTVNRLELVVKAEDMGLNLEEIRPVWDHEGSEGCCFCACGGELV